MKHSSWMAAVCAAAIYVPAATSTCAQTASAGASPPPPNPQIDVAYATPSDPALMPVYQHLKDRKVLETLQRFLYPLELPQGQKLTIKFDQCGDTSPAHSRGGPVTICYEYVGEIEQMTRDMPSHVVLVQGVITKEEAIDGPVIQEVLHETAKGVFDVLGVPVLGQIDDAADRLSAFLMLQFGPDIAWDTIAGTAYFLAATSTAPPANARTARGIVHGDIQHRYDTMLCIAFGGQFRHAFKPTQEINFYKFIDLPGRDPVAGNIPLSTAQSCSSRYDEVKYAFDRLILPHHVDRQKLPLVRQYRGWIKSGR
jgi:Putative metallopeptidase